MPRRWRTVGALALCACQPQGGAAQQADLYLGPGRLPDFPLPRAEVPVLTLERERLFAASAFGRRVARALQAASDTLAAENRRIEAELTGEERALTERRAEVPPEEFRALADAFDARVVALRRAQDAKARALQRREEAERQVFYEAVLPVLAELMAELGGAVILDDRAVFLSTGQIDITDAAIARVDAAIGDGSDLAPASPAAPGTAAPRQEPGGSPESSGAESGGLDSGGLDSGGLDGGGADGGGGAGGDGPRAPGAD